MKTHAPADDSAAVARLASQVDRIERQLVRLAAVEHDVKLHGSAITRLGDLVSTGLLPDASPSEPGEKQDHVPPEWLTVRDADTATEWLLATTGWVRSVWSRYAALPTCWPWHPSVVAELMACRESWHAATGEDASPDGLSGWHDRWRPGAAIRVGKALTGCARAEGLHAEGAQRWVVTIADATTGPHPEKDVEALTGLACWWATDRDGTPPGLRPATEEDR
jgi:hypothetical protein